MFYKNTEQIQNSITASRKSAGLTQADLADGIGVTRQTIIAMEKGNYTPSVLLAVKLVQALHKKVDELFWI